MDTAQPKLSATGTINFRPGPLAGKIAVLQREILAAGGGKITATDIVREGLLGCWEQVRTHLLHRNTTRVIAAGGGPAGTISPDEMALHLQAKRLGLDPAAILRDALGLAADSPKANHGESVKPACGEPVEPAA